MMEPGKGNVLKSWLRHLPAIVGLVLLVGAIYVVQREFRHLSLKDIGEALSAIPLNSLVFAFVWTILSYFILTFYDRLCGSQGDLWTGGIRLVLRLFTVA
jgi:uncharacterized membrane protein YbhN (UPF0104 family)